MNKETPAAADQSMVGEKRKFGALGAPDRLDILLCVNEALNEKMAQKIAQELDAQDAQAAADKASDADVLGSNTDASTEPEDESDPGSPWSTGSAGHPIRLSPMGHHARMWLRFGNRLGRNLGHLGYQKPHDYYTDFVISTQRNCV